MPDRREPVQPTADSPDSPSHTNDDFKQLFDSSYRYRYPDRLVETQTVQAIADRQIVEP